VGRIVSRLVLVKAAFLLAFLQNRIVFPVDTYRDTVVDTATTKKADSPMSLYVSFLFKQAFEKCSFHILQLVGSGVGKLPTASLVLRISLASFKRATQRWAIDLFHLPSFVVQPALCASLATDRLPSAARSRRTVSSLLSVIFLKLVRSGV
jgi:hypothetical protein